MRTGIQRNPHGDRTVTDPDANAFLERLHADPAICAGQVCSLILDMLAGGDTIEEVLDSYPTITREDIAAALAYGASLASERILPLARQS